MSNRNWMIVAFAAGAAVALAGVIYLTTRPKPGGAGGSSEPVVKAAEPKVGAPTVLAWEYGPKRENGIYAYREQRSGQATLHGVYFGAAVLSVDYTQSLIRFIAKYKDATIQAPKEVREANIRWTGKSANSDATVNARYLVHERKWRIDNRDYTSEQLSVLAQALADLEAMKKVPFSVTP